MTDDRQRLIDLIQRSDERKTRIYLDYACDLENRNFQENNSGKKSLIELVSLMSQQNLSILCEYAFDLEKIQNNVSDIKTKTQVNEGKRNSDNIPSKRISKARGSREEFDEDKFEDFDTSLVECIKGSSIVAPSTRTKKVSKNINRFEETGTSDDIEVTNIHIEGDFIIGTVSNKTKSNYTSISISFDVYDKRSKHIGDTIACIDYLEAGTSWRFKAFVDDAEEVKDYKITDIHANIQAQVWEISDDLELLNAYKEGYFIKGEVKNKAPMIFEDCQIVFNLYDRTGIHIGNAVSNIEDLEPGVIWRFSAFIDDDDEEVKNVKLISLYGRGNSRVEDVPGELEIRDIQIKEDYIRGKIRNTGKTTQTIHTRFNLYDHLGAHIGNASGSIQTVKPGGTCNVKAWVEDDEQQVQSFKLIRVSYN